MELLLFSSLTTAGSAPPLHSLNTLSRASSFVLRPPPRPLHTFRYQVIHFWTLRITPCVCPTSLPLAWAKWLLPRIAALLSALSPPARQPLLRRLQACLTMPFPPRLATMSSTAVSPPLLAFLASSSTHRLARTTALSHAPVLVIPRSSVFSTRKSIVSSLSPEDC